MVLSASEASRLTLLYFSCNTVIVPSTPCCHSVHPPTVWTCPHSSIWLHRVCHGGCGFQAARYRAKNICRALRYRISKARQKQPDCVGASIALPSQRVDQRCSPRIYSLPRACPMSQVTTLGSLTIVVGSQALAALFRSGACYRWYPLRLIGSSSPHDAALRKRVFCNE